MYPIFTELAVTPGSVVDSAAPLTLASPTVANAATKEMIRLAVDDGVRGADDALPAAGAKVIASEDMQRGARTLQEKGPGHAEFQGR